VAAGVELLAASVLWRESVLSACSSSALAFTMLASCTATVVFAMARLASAEATLAAKVRGSITARLSLCFTGELKSTFTFEICPESCELTSTVTSASTEPVAEMLRSMEPVLSSAVCISKLARRSLQAKRQAAKPAAKTRTSARRTCQNPRYPRGRSIAKIPACLRASLYLGHGYPAGQEKTWLGTAEDATSPGDGKNLQKPNASARYPADLLDAEDPGRQEQLGDCWLT
jgi:hypothetical protein